MSDIAANIKHSQFVAGNSAQKFVHFSTASSTPSLCAEAEALHGTGAEVWMMDRFFLL